MPLTLFVVTDNNNNTRVVAAELGTAEREADYEWILQALKDSTTDDIGNTYLPLVIMCDEDLGLNAALKKNFKGVQRFNCLWHVALHNIPKTSAPL